MVTARMPQTAFVDLVKAFEMVRLELAWMAGLRLHFPPMVLRLVLESFAPLPLREPLC